MAAVLLLVFAVLLLGCAAAVLLLEASATNGPDQAELKFRVLGSDVPVHEAELQRSRAQDPILRVVSARLARAGIETEPRILGRVLLGAAAIAAVALLSLGVGAGLVAVAVMAMLGFAWLSRREARRRAELVQQLPDFLEHVTRSLGAGNSLESAMSEATQESVDPVRSLFGSVTRQVRLGAPVDDVLQEAAELHRVAELRIMAMAARVNRRFGGSLRRIFKSLIQAIRERDSATRELRALTSETRFSAFVLAIVPIGLMVYILLQNPDYYSEMWADGTGRLLILFSLVLQAAGVATIWRMLQAAEEEQ